MNASRDVDEDSDEEMLESFDHFHQVPTSLARTISQIVKDRI